MSNRAQPDREFGERTVDEVRSCLADRREIALLDAREEDSYAEAHPLFAASLPLGRLELDVLDRIPRMAAPIVVYDNGEGLARRVAQRLADIGFVDVAVLQGGLAAWRAAGAELFRDVNVPSKAFGELVEARRHTPSIGAEELQAKLNAGENVVILDARRFDEYRTMSIPGATSVPGAELVLRVRELARDPLTLVVVNCAGRTRSIIGAQSLVNAAIPNPVAALRNGTIGWTLAGLELDHGQTRRCGAVNAADRAAAARSARVLADRAGVVQITRKVLDAWSADPARTTYRFDVRTPEEYLAGRARGFKSAPGGQLVQETDVFAPVRGARIVVADDDGVRANMSASWLAQMGWEVFVLDEAAGTVQVERGPPTHLRPAPPVVSPIGVDELGVLMRQQRATLIDLGPSAQYERGHIPGSWFVLRSQAHKIGLAARPGSSIVLISGDGLLAAYAAPEVETLIGAPPLVLSGGVAAWRAAGGAIESGASRLLSPATDRYKRPYEGTDNPREAMQAYLDWEYGLVSQLARDNTHHFRVV